MSQLDVIAELDARHHKAAAMIIRGRNEAMAEISRNAARYAAEQDAQRKKFVCVSGCESQSGDEFGGVGDDRDELGPTTWLC